MDNATSFSPINPSNAPAAPPALLAIAFNSAKSVLPKLNVTETEKNLSLREFIIYRLLYTEGTQTSPQKDDDMNFPHGFLTDLKIMLSYKVSEPDQENWGKELFKRLKDPTEAAYLEILSNLKFVFNFSIKSILSASSPADFAIPAPSNDTFPIIIKPLISQLKIALTFLSRYCKNKSASIQEALKNSKKETAATYSLARKKKRAAICVSNIKLHGEDIYTSLIIKLSSLSKKIESKTGLLDNILQRPSFGTNPIDGIRLFSSLESLPSILKDVSGTTLDISKFCNEASSVTAAGVSCFQLNMVAEEYRKMTVQLTAYYVAIPNFIRAVTSYSLKKLLPPVSEESTYSRESLWLELIDEETATQKTRHISHKTITSTKKTSKKHPAKQEEEAEEILSLPENPQYPLEIPLSKEISKEIIHLVDLFSSSSIFQEVDKKDSYLASQLQQNYHFHCSQLLLHFQWVISSKNCALSCHQLFSSMNGMIEMAIGLRYFHTFEKLPEVHCHERALQEVHLFSSMTAEERFLVTSMKRATIWNRYPFTMAENYQERKPLALEVAMMASGDLLQSPLPAVSAMKENCKLGFSILGNLLDQKLSYPQDLFEKLEKVSYPISQPQVISPLQEKCNSIEAQLFQSQCSPLLRKEIIGHLYRLNSVVSFGQTVESQGQYDSIVLEGIAVLPTAVEVMLRLLVLEQTHSLNNSHDFEELCKELGDDYSGYARETKRYQLGRAFYMPASYSYIPLAKAMASSPEKALSLIGLEYGFALQGKARTHSPLQDWMPWIEKGLILLEKLASTLPKNSD